MGVHIGAQITVSLFYGIMICLSPQSLRGLPSCQPLLDLLLTSSGVWTQLTISWILVDDGANNCAAHNARQEDMIIMDGVRKCLDSQAAMITFSSRFKQARVSDR
jgi:hypothetical protein